MLHVLLVFAELRKTLAKVSAIAQFVPVSVGDRLCNLYRRVEVPVSRRELVAFLHVQRLTVERSECSELLPQFLLAMLQSLSCSLLCNAVNKTVKSLTRFLHFAKCIVVTRSVCLSVCVSVRGRTPTLLHGPRCNENPSYKLASIPI